MGGGGEEGLCFGRLGFRMCKVMFWGKLMTEAFRDLPFQVWRWIVASTVVWDQFSARGSVIVGILHEV